MSEEPWDSVQEEEDESVLEATNRIHYMSENTSMQLVFKISFYVKYWY